jgi:hypothetical protein
MLYNHLEKKLVESFEKLLELSRSYAFNKVSNEPSVIEENLIFPVAVYLRKLMGEPDVRQRFSLLLDLFDIVVRTTTLMLRSRIKQIDPKYESILDSKSPSLGDWVSCLNEFRKKLEDAQDDFFSPYYLSIRTAYKVICEKELVNLRNDTKGHALTLPAHEINKYVQLCIPTVNDLIKMLYDLLSLKMMKVETSRHLTSGRYTVSLFSLNGSNPIFVKQDLEFTPSSDQKDILNTVDEIILFNKDLSDFISLYPYLLYTDCPSCGQPRTLIIDYENKYLDLQIGHRVTFDNGVVTRC